MVWRREWDEEDRLERERRDRLRAQAAQEHDEEAAKRNRRRVDCSHEDDIYQREQAYEFEDEMRLKWLFREIERELAAETAHGTYTGPTPPASPFADASEE